MYTAILEGFVEEQSHRHHNHLSGNDFYVLRILSSLHTRVLSVWNNHFRDLATIGPEF